MNIECEIQPGQSVLHVAQDNNIHIKSVCRGVPSCAECRVRVIDGDYNVVQPSSTELGLIGTAWFVDRRRLSCQLRCFGDITVDLTEQVARQESNSAKKPRGRYNKDELQESRAVLGNLVMNDEDADRAAVGVKADADDEASQVEGEARATLDSAGESDEIQREVSSDHARASAPSPNSPQPRQTRGARPSSPQGGRGGPRPPRGEDKPQGPNRGGGRNNRRRNQGRGGGGGRNHGGGGSSNRGGPR